MYRKILIPLDGSELAESVLSHVEDVAKGCGTEEVILVSVTELIAGYRPIIAARKRGEQMSPAGDQLLSPSEPVTALPVAVGKKFRQAERYLHRIARRLEKKGIKVRLKVLLGDPAQEIVNYAKENDCDLIALASHGRSGISRWAHSIGAFGGVADKVLRASHIPVLVVKALK